MLLVFSLTLLGVCVFAIVLFVIIRLFYENRITQEEFTNGSHDNNIMSRKKIIMGKIEKYFKTNKECILKCRDISFKTVFDWHWKKELLINVIKDKRFSEIEYNEKIAYYYNKLNIIMDKLVTIPCNDLIQMYKKNKKIGNVIKFKSLFSKGDSNVVSNTSGWKTIILENPSKNDTSVIVSNKNRSNYQLVFSNIISNNNTSTLDIEVDNSYILSMWISINKSKVTSVDILKSIIQLQLTGTNSKKDTLRVDSTNTVLKDNISRGQLIWTNIQYTFYVGSDYLQNTTVNLKGGSTNTIHISDIMIYKSNRVLQKYNSTISTQLDITNNIITDEELCVISEEIDQEFKRDKIILEEDDNIVSENIREENIREEVRDSNTINDTLKDTIYSTNDNMYTDPKCNRCSQCNSCKINNRCNSCNKKKKCNRCSQCNSCKINNRCNKCSDNTSNVISTPGTEITTIVRTIPTTNYPEKIYKRYLQNSEKPCNKDCSSSCPCQNKTRYCTCNNKYNTCKKCNSLSYCSKCQSCMECDLQSKPLIYDRDSYCTCGKKTNTCDRCNLSRYCKSCNKCSKCSISKCDCGTTYRKCPKCNNLKYCNKCKSCISCSLVYTDNNMLPKKEIFKEYGWSYMPPQSWSVPQQRPPVCITDCTEDWNPRPLPSTGSFSDSLIWEKELKKLDDPVGRNFAYPGHMTQMNTPPKYPKWNTHWNNN